MFARAAPLLVSLLVAPRVGGLHNGVGQLPMMGWTVGPIEGEVWTGNEFNVSAQMMKNAADWLVETGLRDLGYDYVMLDAGWPACDKQHWCTHRTPAGYCGVCASPAPRLANGDVEVDNAKFPPSSPSQNDGIKIVADYVHARGLKVCIRIDEFCIKNDEFCIYK